jgi:hypothetical protein
MILTDIVRKEPHYRLDTEIQRKSLQTTTMTFQLINI